MHTAQLTISIYEHLSLEKLSEHKLVKLRNLAESDLRLAEIRVEITNLALAFFAIIFSILLSDQLLGFIIQIFSWFDSIFYSLGVQLSIQFEFGVTISEMFVRGVYISLWWQLINLLAGLGFVAVRALVSIYYFYYRPAYALHRSLFLIDGTPISATTVPSTNNRSAFIRIINSLFRKG